MTSIFDEYGTPSAFKHKRKESNGAFEENIIDTFEDSWYDVLNDGTFELRGFSTSEGFIIENNGLFTHRIGPDGTIFDAATGDYLGKIKGKTVFDASGNYRGMLPAGATSEQQYLLVVKMLS